ncbi:MAG: type II toxin-antitoxin system ParD family antitoxin [Pyrinomonadaceae bacterium]
MQITLTPEIENIVKQKVASGNYASETDVIRESLRLLQQRDEEKFKSLREDLQAAYEQLQRGESMPFDIKAAEQIKSAGRERRRQKSEERVNGEG